jgi:hypothetical protein
MVKLKRVAFAGGDGRFDVACARPQGPEKPRPRKVRQNVPGPLTPARGPDNAWYAVLVHEHPNGGVQCRVTHSRNEEGNDECP